MLYAHKSVKNFGYSFLLRLGDTLQRIEERSHRISGWLQPYKGERAFAATHFFVMTRPAQFHVFMLEKHHSTLSPLCLLTAFLLGLSHPLDIIVSMAPSISASIHPQIKTLPM